MITALYCYVGITGLEPATSRPPDVCATNCAKSRLFSKSAAKIVTSWHICKFMFPFFVLKCLIYMDSCRYRLKAFAFTHFF